MLHSAILPKEMKKYEFIERQGLHTYSNSFICRAYRCGANWQSEGQSGNSVLIQFVEPRGIVFYRLHPNYFFENADNRRIRIHGSGFSTITVCQSRNVERPR